MIHLIAAVGNRGELGFQNRLLCHLPADLKRFKELTSGHTILMGRKTWDSLPIKPLPNRRNLVLSRQQQIVLDGAEVFSTKEAALATLSESEDLFVIGGANVYQQFIYDAEIIHLTRIFADFEADTFFPPFETNCWKITENIPFEPDEKNRYHLLFQTLTRIQ